MHSPSLRPFKTQFTSRSANGNRQLHFREGERNRSRDLIRPQYIWPQRGQYKPGSAWCKSAVHDACVNMVFDMQLVRFEPGLCRRGDLFFSPLLVLLTTLGFIFYDEYIYPQSVGRWATNRVIDYLGSSNSRDGVSVVGVPRCPQFRSRIRKLTANVNEVWKNGRLSSSQKIPRSARCAPTCDKEGKKLQWAARSTRAWAID
ncbi:hypothetical protein DFH06DRAFT_1136867 [Mycena polygramma]|nr:hypothetical protein DFH06DRAFT_1136867 [Mycena polygramma]